MDREDRLRARAGRIAEFLKQLWGDLPAPGPDPRLTVLVDTVAADDDHGRAAQVVVHGDGLTYQQLADVLRDAGPRSLGTLPPALRERLTAAGVLPSNPLSPGMAALPDERCGLWELDAASGVVTFDATCARLLGAGHGPGRAPLPTPLDGRGTVSKAAAAVVHPDDHPHVTAALEEALRTGRRYETRFRALMPDASYAWRASRARLLPASGTAPTRLVGFIAADD